MSGQIRPAIDQGRPIWMFLSDAARREIVCVVMSRHGEGAATFARRWSSHHRSFGDSEAADLWAAVADVADTLIEGYRLAIVSKTGIDVHGPNEIEGDSLVELMLPA
jgi:hypothetical protein